MQFTDCTILGGGIHSERRHDIGALSRPAVDTCRERLDTLRRKEMRTSHGVPGLPGFDVSLGFPDLGIPEGDREVFAARGHWFCVYQDGFDKPFQLNLVLPSIADCDYEEYALGTLLALSLLGEPIGDRFERMERDIHRLMARRPLLATTLFPFVNNPDVVRLAADFATCFAAAMLEEDIDAA